MRADDRPYVQSSSNSQRFGTQTADLNSLWVATLFEGSRCWVCGHIVDEHAWTEWPRQGDIRCFVRDCDCYLRQGPRMAGLVRQRSEDLGV